MSLVEISPYADHNDIPVNRYVTIVEFMDRLEELKSIKVGWLDGTGEKPGTEGIDWIGHFFENIAPAGTWLPSLYPTPEGGIQAEWPGKASLEINLPDHIGEFYNFIKEDSDLTLNLDCPECQKILFRELNKIQGMT
jgi:hypothetical protein